MVEKLTFGSFKSLRTLELDLGHVNIFIGANGSGKSNLLEGIGVLGAAAFGKVEDETLLRRGVRPGVPQLYKSAFPGEGQGRGTGSPHIYLEAAGTAGAKYAVSLWNANKKASAAWTFKSERLEDGTTLVFGRSPNELKKKNPEQGYAALKAVDLDPADPALKLLDELRNFNIYSPNTPSLRGLLQDQQSRDPLGLSGGRLPEAVKELLEAAATDEWLGESLEQVRELLDWATDFSATPSLGVPLSPSAARSRLVIQFTDRYMAKRRNKLTGYDASEGALYVLFLAALALHPRAPRFLAVDNVDQALNPVLAKKLTGSLCDWALRNPAQRQWLITAHNPAVLDALPLPDDRVRLFAVDRDDRGHTTVRRVDTSGLSTVRRGDWPVSRMWVGGLIGGVPNA